MYRSVGLFEPRVRTTWVLVGGLVTLAGALGPMAGVARAQEAAPVSASADEEARALFAAGRTAFTDGRYDDALGHFQRAYDLSQRPQLLYNIASTHDRLRQDRPALDAFERYLAAVPDAENAAEVRGRIEALRLAIARQDELERAAAASAASSEPSASTSSAAPSSPTASGAVPVATLVLSGLALVAGGTAVGTWVAANDAYASRQTGCAASGGCTESEIGSVASLVDATNALWITAAALGVGAAIALPLELGAFGGAERASSVALVVRPAGVGLEGSF